MRLLNSKEVFERDHERGRGAKRARTNTWRRARVNGETQMASSGMTLDLNKPSIAANARCCIASTAVRLHSSRSFPPACLSVYPSLERAGSQGVGSRSSIGSTRYIVLNFRPARTSSRRSRKNENVESPSLPSSPPGYATDAVKNN